MFCFEKGLKEETLQLLASIFRKSAISNLSFEALSPAAKYKVLIFLHGSLQPAFPIKVLGMPVAVEF